MKKCWCHSVPSYKCSECLKMDAWRKIPEYAQNELLSYAVAIDDPDIPLAKVEKYQKLFDKWNAGIEIIPAKVYRAFCP